MCILGCPGDVCVGLGANVCGARARFPPGQAATVAGAGRVLGALTTPGGAFASCCGPPVCMIALGASAFIIMFEPALTDSALLDG